MGLASNVSSAVLDSVLSSDEMRGRSDEERSFVSPQATPDGQVVERQQPQAAPAFQAPDSGWD